MESRRRYYVYLQIPWHRTSYQIIRKLGIREAWRLLLISVWLLQEASCVRGQNQRTRLGSLMHIDCMLGLPHQWGSYQNVYLWENSSALPTCSHYWSTLVIGYYLILGMSQWIYLLFFADDTWGPPGLVPRFSGMYCPMSRMPYQYCWIGKPTNLIRDPPNQCWKHWT